MIHVLYKNKVHPENVKGLSKQTHVKILDRWGGGVESKNRKWLWLKSRTLQYDNVN